MNEHLIAGSIAALIAGLAVWSDRRRMRRRNPDKVGFMPWTAVFFCALIVALVLIGLGVREWLSG